MSVVGGEAGGLPERWTRIASLLARMSPAVTGGLLPRRLLDDLTAIATGAVSRGEYEPRVLAVTALPGSRTVGGALHVMLARTPTRPLSRLMVSPSCDPYDTAQDGTVAAAELRAALAGAHATLLVVDYGDIARDDTSVRLHQVATWLSVALDHTGTERTTLVVDGRGHERSTPVVAAAWARQRARAKLHLPASWPDEAIVPIDSALAVEAVRSDTRWADEDWRASGMPILLDRVTAPLAADPAALYTSTAVTRFHAACTWMSRRCTEILALAVPVKSEPEHAAVRLTGSAQRRARLAAMAAGPLAADVAQTDIAGWRLPPTAPASRLRTPHTPTRYVDGAL
ncbi:hypothetical protein AB0M95_15560 [Sphaerisporangium sp. NPDC051017]|uniref:hypothetical protein n=1 Tax=Sphaerisporangium sp. NPDC051017 TaxID=3154636 RepID=UPI003431CCB0